MLPRFVLLSAIGLGVLAFELPSQAQPREPAPPTPEVLPVQGQDENTPAPDAEKKKPASPSAVGGYAYSDKPAAGSVPHARFRRTGPVVNLPGFEQVEGGGSRLFVQLSQSVPVEEQRAEGTITYVLKGASPRVHNNTNELVTVHFNTPVVRARLVPHGQDLHFVVHLRAAVTPTFKVEEAQDKSARLVIDFPQGEFLQLGAGPIASTPAATRTPSKAARVGKRAAPKVAPAGPKP
jgi:hypothetical protein